MSSPLRSHVRVWGDARWLQCHKTLLVSPMLSINTNWRCPLKARWQTSLAFYHFHKASCYAESGYEHNRPNFEIKAFWFLPGREQSMITFSLNISNSHWMVRSVLNLTAKSYISMCFPSNPRLHIPIFLPVFVIWNYPESFPCKYNLALCMPVAIRKI